jgi:DNA-binding Lrp family transcriptional regulator
MAHLTDEERRVLEEIQDGLPLDPEPYRIVGERTGLGEARVLELVSSMLAERKIKRIGAVPNHYALGYRANAMTVWDVDDAAVDALGRRVGALPFVSHCYRRPRRLPHWRYNLFAMVHGRDRAETEKLIAGIVPLLGAALRARDVLYSTRILKKTGLRL